MFPHGLPVRASSQPPGANPTKELAQKALEVFDRIDTNHDGELSKKEVKAALGSSWLKDRNAAATAAVFDMFGEVVDLNISFPEKRHHRFAPEGLDKSGVTREDLAALGTGTGDKTALATIKETTRMYNGAVDKVQHIDRRLFPNGIASIRPEGVQQGTIGDCYFLSQVAGLAKINPKAIQDMIKPHADGSFTVDFVTGPVTVSPLTEADFATYSGTPHGAWVTVLEKAFYKEHPNAEDGALVRGMKSLTGIGGDILPLVFTTTYDRIRNELESAQKEGRLVVVSRTWTPKLADGVSSGHVLTVINYDRKTDTVTVRDPGGKTGPKGDGYHTYSLKKFYDSYDLLGYQSQLFTAIKKAADDKRTGKALGTAALSLGTAGLVSMGVKLTGTRGIKP